jgi:hypothetical protein
MKRLVLALIAIFFMSLPSLADEPNYGFIRVVVHGVNLEHNYFAQLVANKNNIGLPFSHANQISGSSRRRTASEPYPWAPISVRNLSANSNSTQIYATYNGIPSFCNFKFSVEFSLDGQNTIATWGPFNAPNDSQAGVIPIGTKCTDGMRVCSSDPALQKKMLAEHARSLVVSYNNWKRSYDQTVKSRVDKNVEEAKEATEKLKTTPLPDLTQGEKILQKYVDVWTSELQKLRDGQASQFDELKGDPKQDLGKPSDVINKAAQEGYVLDPRAGEVNAGFSKNVGLLVRENQEMNDVYKADGSLTQADVRIQKHLVQSTDLMVHGVLEGEAFVHVAGRMLEEAHKVSPNPILGVVETGVTLCEVVRGLEFCIGRRLTDDERNLRTCRLLIGKLFPWRTIKLALLGENADPLDRMLVDKIESDIKAGRCGDKNALLYRPLN